jgi:capsular exopolysaccharide synthesis family protein
MSLVSLFDTFVRRQRRVFLLVTVAVLVAATAVTLTLPKQYRGVSTLFVGENRPLSAGADAVQLDDVLARTYAELLTTVTLQGQVARRLPGVNTAQLEQSVSVQAVPGTRLLQISALDTDPRTAQKIANTYAEVFVSTQREALSRSGQARLDGLSNRIGALAQERDRLRGRPASETAGRRAQIENELTALRQSFTATQESSTLQGSNVSVASVSTVPESPAKPQTKALLALGVVFALIFGAGAALTRNVFDRRVRNEDELSELLGGVPVLARVPFGRTDGNQRAMNEAFEFLRVNLRLSAVDSQARVIAVTSSLAGDGKSTVCLRLARALAEQGADVVTADCDLRKPMLANHSRLRDSQGVTTALATGTSPLELLTPSDVRGVRVLTSGPVPPNPSALLGLLRFQTVVEELRAAADYVIIDTPPVPAGADTSSVSQVVDGVVLVVDLNRSDREALQATREQLEKANARILGLVMNRVPRRLAQYGYGPEHTVAAAAEPADSVPRARAGRQTPAP